MKTATVARETEREWVIAAPHPEREHLARTAGVPVALAQLLLNRGVDTAAAVRTFLVPDFKALLPPDELPNATAAAR